MKSLKQKKRQKNIKNSLIALTIIGIIALVFWFSVSQTMLTVGGNPLETKTFTFDSYTGTATAPIFGSTINSPSNYFCGNDGDVTISNSFSSDEDSISMASSLAAKDRDCQGNGITAKTTVSSGTLYFSCDTAASNQDEVFQVSERAKGECIVKVNGDVVFQSSSIPNRGGATGPLSVSKSESGSYVVAEESSIELEVITNGIKGIALSSSASANLQVDFVKKEVPSDGTDTSTDTSTDTTDTSTDSGKTTSPSKINHLIYPIAFISLVIVILLVTFIIRKRR